MILNLEKCFLKIFEAKIKHRVTGKKAIFTRVCLKTIFLLNLIENIESGL